MSPPAQGPRREPARKKRAGETHAASAPAARTASLFPHEAAAPDAPLRGAAAIEVTPIDGARTERATIHGVQPSVAPIHGAQLHGAQHPGVQQHGGQQHGGQRNRAPIPSAQVVLTPAHGTPTAAPRAAGVVLCGGHSTRLGRDKALETVDGVELVARAARVLADAGLPVVLATGSTPRYAHLGLDAVLDRVSGAGPLAGIEAALDRCATTSTAGSPAHVCVLACDVPGVDAALVGALLADARERALDVLVLESARGLEPLVSVWSTATLPFVRAALDAGDFAVHAAVELAGRDPVARVGVRAFAGTLDNVNTEADLARARARRVGSRRETA